jgi:hypothetical protein
MRRKPIICNTIINNRAHVFALTKADLGGEQKAARFQACQEDIYRRTTLAGYAYFTVGGDLRVRRKNLQGRL